MKKRSFGKIEWSITNPQSTTVITRQPQGGAGIYLHDMVYPAGVG